MRALVEADDFAVFGIRGHPVPGLRRKGWGAGFDKLMEPLAMARSGSGISANFASTALSPFVLSAPGPRRPSACSSRARSFIAARSSSVNPVDIVPAAVLAAAFFPTFAELGVSLTIALTPTDRLNLSQVSLILEIASRMHLCFNGLSSVPRQDSDKCKRPPCSSAGNLAANAGLARERRGG